MKQNVFIVTFVSFVALCIIIFPCLLVAEETASVVGENFTEEASVEAPAVSEAMMPEEPLPAPGEPQTQWILGKVVLLDPANNSVTVHYVDYDTNSEQDLVFVTDEKTTYENAQSLVDLKPNDNVSIDYRIVDGKNIARVIGIEKTEEDSSPLPLSPDD
ncbi:MAG: hypothetical protein C4540_02225 [Candidatus Omnitrophota bacterium]|jgi:hypothetical protein|nr:MAG: hypothetical protein C4540_02225 [Candidatus Omnitrophota bacterium]